MRKKRTRAIAQRNSANTSRKEGRRDQPLRNDQTANLNHLHHVVDVLRGPRVTRCGDDVERFEVLEEQRRVLVGEVAKGHAVPRHASDNLVVNVCQIVDVIHLVSSGGEGGEWRSEYPREGVQ